MHKHAAPRASKLCLLLYLGAASGCGFPQAAPVPKVPAEKWVERARQRWVDSSEEELLVGRRAFMENCNRCHRHPDVTYLSEDEWLPTMERMSKMAKLSETQGQAVLRFVLTARAEVVGARGAFVEPAWEQGARPDSATEPAPAPESASHN